MSVRLVSWTCNRGYVRLPHTRVFMVSVQDEEWGRMVGLEDQDIAEVTITAAGTGEAALFRVIDEDPWFTLTGESKEEVAEAVAPVFRGDAMHVPSDGENAPDRRIVGISITHSFLGRGWQILAPKSISEPDPWAPYLWHEGADKEPIQLRPGTAILGGRYTGFYDSDGLILAAEHTGGDIQRSEDWAFYVAPFSNSWSFSGSNWVTLSSILHPTSASKILIDRGYREQRATVSDIETVDALIRAGEQELVEYLSISPGTLEILSPRQFEDAVYAIFKSLGFDVERLGQWNQADGGVDLIAASKTPGEDEVRTAIQCKASKNRVSAKPIRELNGVLARFHASRGIVATSSSFTGPAIEEADTYYWNIGLEDRNALHDRALSVLGLREPDVPTPENIIRNVLGGPLK